MKTLSKKTVDNKVERAASNPLFQLKSATTAFIYLIALSTTLSFASCEKQDANHSKGAVQPVNQGDLNTDMDLISNCKGLSSVTIKELKEARTASSRYQNINNAFADGYADINVVMPNMGYHFEKASLVDTVFDPRHPELLVYNKTIDGNFKLVAVEYAVPLDQSKNAPKGFTGSADVWDHNTDFGLWLLHAWVWKFNPDGVFNPTNPNVIVR
jgi:hypothetical protein